MAPPESLPPLVKKVDLPLSGHVTTLFSQDKNFSVGGNQIPNSEVLWDIGVGIKFDVYPCSTNKILDDEIEAFGLGGNLRDRRTTSGSGTT